MKKNDGFTLVELLIVVGIIGIIAAAIGGAVTFACAPSDWRKAEEDAVVFASKIPGSTGQVQCAKKDTDQDGYCGCTIFMKKSPPIPIDCGCERFCFVCTEGCKMVNPGKGIRTNVRTVNYR